MCRDASGGDREQRGRTCIQSGRPRVRAKLYMAAFNERKNDPVIKAFYAWLVARGKTFKQAMTACMRKRWVLMNMLVGRGEQCDPSHAT
jgi:transposase